MTPVARNSAAPIGIMGGAFDPVHYGHLRTAAELADYLQLEQVRFVPSANPPHRAPHFAPADRRVRMLEAALADTAWGVVDARELERAGPSWSVVTLEELRAETPERSLIMILGMDAFLGLCDWHRWEELIDLTHIVVACRPGSTLKADGRLGEFLAQHRATRPAELTAAPHGRVLVHEVTQLEISSSDIRQRIAAGRSIEFLLPTAVRKLIETTGCYAGNRAEPDQEHRLHAE